MHAVSEAQLGEKVSDMGLDGGLCKVQRLADRISGVFVPIVIALDRDVDLHRAVSLLERGCPPDLALQIVF